MKTQDDSSCVSMTPSVVQNLNIAMTTGDGNTQKHTPFKSHQDVILLSCALKRSGYHKLC